MAIFFGANSVLDFLGYSRAISLCLAVYVVILCEVLRHLNPVVWSRFVRFDWKLFCSVVDGKRRIGRI